MITCFNLIGNDPVLAPFIVRVAQHRYIRNCALRYGNLQLSEYDCTSMFCNRRHSPTTGMTSNYSRSFGRSQGYVETWNV